MSPAAAREVEIGEMRGRVSGHGPNLLLVSGLNGRASFWDAVTPGLEAAHRVANFDQRGCGATPDDRIDWTIETLASDAATFAEAAFGGETFAVIGHSTGGAIAQCMAATRPEAVRAAILSGTWSQSDAYMQALFTLRMALLKSDPDLDAAFSDLMRTPPEHFASAASRTALDAGVTIRRIRALLGHDGSLWRDAVRCPIFVLAAADDRIVPPHLSRALHGSLPTADWSVLDTGGHFFPRTRPIDFLDRTESWFARIG